MKRCKKCGEAKPYSEFDRAAGMRDGFRSDCKSCNLADKKQRYRANPQPFIERTKRWQRENRERHLAKQREYRSKNPGRDRPGHLRRKFGITQADYERMLHEQLDGCAICGESRRDSASFHVDHDHGNDAVRGLLCFRCNAGIGQFRELPARLRRAAEYLDTARGEWIEQPSIQRLAKDRARELARAGR